MKPSYQEIITLSNIKNRFLNKIKIINDCWIWQPIARTKQGRGMCSITIAKKVFSITAHKLAYYLFKGDIAPSFLVEQNCQNKICVNPDHLTLIPASQHPSHQNTCKIKIDDIPLIIERIKSGEQYPSIAKDFNVGVSIISGIKVGKIWTHLTGGPITIENPIDIFSRAEKLAYEYGYKMDESGKLYNNKGRLIKGTMNKGYLAHNIPVGEIIKTVKFHRLQAYQLFGGKIYEPYIVVRHLDGNSLNNRPSNLALGTVQENHLDMKPEDMSRYAKIGSKNRKKK